MYRQVFLISMCVLLCGCGSSSSSSDSPREGAFQFVNAISDAPPLDIEISEGDDVIQTINALDFGQASSQSVLSQDNYTFSVSYEDPEGGPDISLLNNIDFDVLRNLLDVIVLRGTTQLPDVVTLEKDIDPAFSDDDEQIEVSVLNTAANSVEVYLTEADSNPSSADLLATIAPGNSQAPTLIDIPDSNEFKIVVIDEASSATTFDSGSFTLNSESLNTIIVGPAVGPDPDTNSGFLASTTGALSFSNEAARAAVRVLNAVADQPSLATIVSLPALGETVSNSDVAFTQVTDFMLLEPGFIAAQTTNPLTGESVSSTISLNEDAFYTVVLGGSAFNDDLNIRAADATFRAIQSAASIQFINGLDETDVEEFDRVDLYALPIGESLADLPPLFGQVPFLEDASGTLAATTYDFVVTTAGTQSILAGPTRITVTPKTALLLVATEGFGGGLPNQIILQSTPL